MMLSKKLFPGFLRRLVLLVLLTLPLCAMMCTEIVYDTGYEATIHRAATVDSVKVTFSDGVSVLEQKTIGPESDSIVVMSSQERTGGFMLTVGVGLGICRSAEVLRRRYNPRVHPKFDANRLRAYRPKECCLCGDSQVHFP